jgi:23S rRNA (adenine-N6)-dimethyltransferase
MPKQHQPGAHELGQNFLIDQSIVRTMVNLAAAGEGTLVEWAAGSGVLTHALASLNRPLEAVEIDQRHIRNLRQSVPPHVCITEGDILRHAPPQQTWTLVCNVPFHITTAVLRRLLTLPQWSRAVLITQWEVARKRAAVGGTTLMTAQWWPWFTFTLMQRIPATAFRPKPSVDAGILLIQRRSQPLVDSRDEYQRWVGAVFNGQGRGIRETLAQAGGLAPSAAREWCEANDVPAQALPKNLTDEQWVSAFLLTRRNRRRR